MTTASTQEPFVFRPSAAHARSRGGDPLVDQTRREISQMIREIAELTKQDIPAERFLSQLCDRTLRAMAAEGIVIWRRTIETEKPIQPSTHATQQLNNPFHPIVRLGRITDQSIPTESLAAHQCMLREVAAEVCPVVVPATPSAIEPDTPANPSDYPAAVVPVEMLTTSGAMEYLMEVFLEPGGGVASQRGYLRFVAQVADLAGEFLRADQLRTLVSIQEINERTEQAIESFERFRTVDSLRSYIVDAMAELFEMDRVTWCDLSNRYPLVAISYTDAFDPKSDAAKRILSEASVPSIPHFPPGDSTDEDQPPQDSIPLATLAVVDGGPRAPNDRFVLMRTTNSSARKEPRNEFGPIQQRELIRLARQGSLAVEQLQHRRRRVAGWLIPRPESATRSSLGKRIKSIVVATVLALVLWVPVPDQVSGTATAIPKSMQRLHALRDAIVNGIHVEHDQQVHPGDLLLSLTDPDLEEQITSLQGRRAVLTQQQVRLTHAMVDDSTADINQFEDLRGQRSITQEELQSIEGQLKLLYSIRDSLVLRSDRHGRVDAWQVHQRLGGKPVGRGDFLLGITSEKTPWLLSVEVDHRRLGKLRRLHRDGELSATATLDDQPDRVVATTVVTFGPSIPGGKQRGRPGSPPKSMMLLRLDPPLNNLGLSNGAPAKVVFRCGKQPLAQLLFGDLWHSVRDEMALRFGLGMEHVGQEDS